MRCRRSDYHPNCIDCRNCHRHLRIALNIHKPVSCWLLFRITQMTSWSTTSPHMAFIFCHREVNIPLNEDQTKEIIMFTKLKSMFAPTEIMCYIHDNYEEAQLYALLANSICVKSYEILYTPEGYQYAIITTYACTREHLRNKIGERFRKPAVVI